MSEDRGPRTGRRERVVGAPMGPDPGTTRAMLILATVGFTLCFWAWTLLSPLAVTLRGELGLTSGQQSLVVTMPLVVGSLGRIPVGALTDRLGAPVMFPAVAALTVVPVLFLGFRGTSLTALLVGGFFLGIGGTAFAVGVPFVSSWHAPSRRGAALGVFGMGSGGAAISALTTLSLVERFGRTAPFILVAVLLAAYAVLARRVLRAPTVAGGPNRPPTWFSVVVHTLTEPVALKLGVLYAIAFGGFVAVSFHLPSHLVDDVSLSQRDAALRTAGFVVAAVLARPVGGWLADRHDQPKVVVRLLVATALSAVLAAVVVGGKVEAAPELVGTLALVATAAGLGAVAGAVVALVATIAQPARLGAVTGVVGAVGGLGGFVPPLLMGVIYDARGSYTFGLVPLAVVAIAGATLAKVGFHRELG